MIDSYVISLARAAERRAHVEKAYARAGIRPIVIDAVDGNALDAAEREARMAPIAERPGSFPFSPGQFGCAASHLMVYDRLIESGAPAAAIFEDDALPPDAALLDAVAAEFLEDGRLDILCLVSFVSKRERVWTLRERAAGGTRHLALERGRTSSAAAYLATRRGAAIIREINTPLRALADSWPFFVREAGLRVGVVKPDIVDATLFSTTIEYPNSWRGRLTGLIPNLLRHRWRRAKHRRKQRFLEG